MRKAINIYPVIELEYLLAQTDDAARFKVQDMLVTLKKKERQDLEMFCFGYLLLDTKQEVYDKEAMEAIYKATEEFKE